MSNESNKSAGEMLKYNISRLFAEAEANISKGERNRAATAKKEKLEKERKKLEKKKKAEEMANSIILLVYNTLKTADSKAGKISKINNILGRLNDSDDSRSGYVIDEDGLTITLDYSHVTYDMATTGGKCFLGECGKKYDPNDAVYYHDITGSGKTPQEVWEEMRKLEMEFEPFDYTYLNEILNEHGISMSRENSSSCPGMEWNYTDIVTIKIGRQPKISHQNVPRR